jgi:hypothetical protein
MLALDQILQQFSFDNLLSGTHTESIELARILVAPPTHLVAAQQNSAEIRPKPR